MHLLAKLETGTYRVHKKVEENSGIGMRLLVNKQSLGYQAMFFANQKRVDIATTEQNILVLPSLFFAIVFLVCRLSPVILFHHLVGFSLLTWSDFHWNKKLHYKRKWLKKTNITPMKSCRITFSSSAKVSHMCGQCRNERSQFEFFSRIKSRNSKRWT